MKATSGFFTTLQEFSKFLEDGHNVHALIVLLWIGGAVCSSSATVLMIYQTTQKGATK